MVSIVIVSHSKKLAEGVKELAEQMSQNKVKIAAAGGLDDESSPIGTDAFKIMEAIELVDSEDGILVLMDIGSAVMNAELATEMLPEEIMKRVLLCEAPLVEGAIAAAAQSMVGANLEAVVKEARRGLQGKQSLIGPQEVETELETPILTNGKEISITVPNKLGLHARPAVRLVEITNKFNNEVSVSVNNKPFVSSTSISQVGTLGAKKGDILVFKVKGDEFLEFEKALKQFEFDNFGDTKEDVFKKEETKKTLKVSASNDDCIQGISASKGIAIGKAKVFLNTSISVDEEIVENSLDEISKFQKAIKNIISETEAIKEKTLRLHGKENAEIFNFHLLLLNDNEKLKEVEKLITENHFSASYAWFKVFTNLEDMYKNMSDQYLRERASDIVEIRNKVIAEISGSQEMEITLSEPSILVVNEIGPAQTLSLDIDNVLGIISQKGGETSHATILARSLGIPSITGLENRIDGISNGDIIGVDGTNGIIYLEKNHPEKIKALREEKKVEEDLFKESLSKAKLPALSSDGIEFQILANISSPKEAKKAFANGADGIGLYRTEFLYMNREIPPKEDEQYEIYKQVCENMQGLPITIRTLDVGGDKPIPYLGIPEETNPFLGLRGIRYCLKNKVIFKAQLRALYRISADYNIRVMFPMVGMLEEVIEAKEILAEVRKELDAEHIAYSKEMKIGIMVEVPSVIFILPQLAKHLDFLSIGTNDLTQYLLAMDRESTFLSKHYSALHPAVLNALLKIIATANKEQIDVSLCGELASNPKATALLSALGLRKFSVSGPVIPRVKEAIRVMDVSNNNKIFKDIIACNTLNEVEKMIHI
ncbi:phosphoenolpyruvate--protein phosphotransferase [Winogradskyella undariae]|uniref:phosphoenolpyruvate--protein phosphotransferase n=1 Tax=Winogradskyella undariae TaxID=1285465 RepID=UPI0015CCD1B3|nr:phosphoenolpyruvate--protein phosphotransferase [Winogradskyella undariae]